MVITQEIIEQSEERCQQITRYVASFLSQNITLSHMDSEKSIARKIDVLTALKEYFVTNIDIDTLPTDEDELNFLNLISSITEQIQIYEIIIGRKNIVNLRRAGQNLAKKQRYSMGIVD